MKAIWSNTAICSLARIREYLEEYNKQASESAFKLLNDAIETLCSAPSIGKPVFDPPNYRDFHIRFGSGGYVIRYRVENETLYVSNIRHYRESTFKTQTMLIHEPAAHFHIGV